MVAEFPPEIAAAILPPESKKAAGARSEDAALPQALSEQERAVFKLVAADAPVHIDELAEASGLGVAELSAVLLGLEMRELVRQLPGRLYVRRL